MGGMTRQTQALGEPPADLAGFPRWPLTTARTVYRAHRTNRGPWWFSSAHATVSDGRFDLSGPSGTCYVAATADSAARERWGAHLNRLRSITGAMADDTSVSALRVPGPLRLADTCASKAANYGVTREIGTVTPYALPQRWAAALHVLGCGGIRYLSRFSTGPRDLAYALFGDAGSRSWPDDPSPAAGRTVAAGAGIAVCDPPRNVKIIRLPAP